MHHHRWFRDYGTFRTAFCSMKVQRRGVEAMTTRNVLLIDGDPGAREELAGALREAGFEVSAFGRLSEACARLGTHRFGCAIVDVVLEDGDGLEAVEKLRQAVPGIPVIVTAAENTRDLEARVRAQNVFYYHVKGFGREELIEAVRGALSRERQGDRGRVPVQKKILVIDDDPDYQDPSKPVGPFFTAYRANVLMQEHGWQMVEDAGRGWRKVVPSPKPRRIIDADLMRRLVDSGAVLIAGGSPLDQYVVTHPRYFFGRSPEHALVNPDNLAICTAHIQCAAFELPFRAGESFGRFPHTGEVLDFLAEAGVLHRAGGAFHWMHDSYPAEAVSLRTGTSENFVILDVTDGDERAIGEVDVFSAPFLIHEEAIYIHEGQSYQVRALDWEGRIARVQAVNTDYYTTASTSVDVQVLAELERAVDGGATKAHGQVLISAKATSFKKVKLYSHETLGWGEINLPEQTMQTTAYWLSVSDEMIERLRREGIWVADLTGYRGPNWEAQRQRARERDGFRCQHCGAPEKPNRQHDVHHLRPFRKFNYVPGQNEAYLEANRLENLTTLCRSCHLRAEAALMMRSALGGLGHLLRHVAPLHLMCDPRDIGVIVEPRSSFTRRPTITIYEKIPAGVGFSEEMYRLHRTLLKAAHDVAARCPCANGCPACIGPTSEESENAKANTLRLIETLLNSQGATHLQDNIRRQIYGRIPELTPADKETPAERPDPHPGQRAGAKRCP